MQKATKKERKIKIEEFCPAPRRGELAPGRVGEWQAECKSWFPSCPERARQDSDKDED
jgi:hypothetical protein